MSQPPIDLPIGKKVPGRPPLDDVPGLRAALCGWFGEAGESYPWRQTEDPYEVLVSEMMLQQTQVATVLGRGYYRRWLQRFPDVESLAVADEAEVLRVWEGLGYYSRARNLQAAARVVVEQYGGEFPRELEQIAALPGVGRYTAGAVASFAFDAAVPAVDANIARVLARLFDFSERVDTAAGSRQLWDWAGELVPESGGRVWNSALMELGQTLCKARSTTCESCPAAAWCVSTEPLSLPMKKARPQVTAIDEHVLVARRGGEILLHQESGRRRKGLWKLPERAAGEVVELTLSEKCEYTITRYRVSLYLYETGEVEARQGECWHRLDALDALPMPSPYRRAIERYLR